MNRIYRITKTLLDFSLSLVISVLLAVPMLVISLVIILNDFGSPFYIQTRVGMNGKTFAMVKFRSMVKNADRLEESLSREDYEMYKKEYKLENDKRLIGWRDGCDGKCFGAFLRRTSIDELPQIIFNVLIVQNMSLVGPRPILPEELENNYNEEERRKLLSVKPGVTGYWQAYAHESAGYNNRRRQEMELFYVKNRSILFDVKILLKTVQTVLWKANQGVQRGGESG